MMYSMKEQRGRKRLSLVLVEHAGQQVEEEEELYCCQCSMMLLMRSIEGGLEPWD